MQLNVKLRQVGCKWLDESEIFDICVTSYISCVFGVNAAQIPVVKCLLI